MKPYRTTLDSSSFDRAARAIGFTFLEASCFCTTYTRGSDVMSIEEPTAETYEDREIATDFRLSRQEKETLGVTT